MTSAAGFPTSNLSEEDIVSKTPGAKVRRNEDHRRQSTILRAHESLHDTCLMLGKAGLPVLPLSRLMK